MPISAESQNILYRLFFDPTHLALCVPIASEYFDNLIRDHYPLAPFVVISATQDLERKPHGFKPQLVRLIKFDRWVCE